MAQKSDIIEFPQAKCVVVSGDIHGDITPLVFKCCVQYGMTDTLIIVAGDCGFGFERPGYYENIYNRCREKLSKANNWLVFIYTPLITKEKYRRQVMEEVKDDFF